MNNFKISVCIPVYNCRPIFLKETIRSALAQKGDFAIEILISDDKSTIDYAEVIESFNSEYIRFYRNNKNLGMVGNWNKVVEKADGDLVLLLGHDDILRDGMFQKYSEIFKNYKDVILCSCDREFINEEGKVISPKRHVNDRSRIFISSVDYFLKCDEVMRLSLRNGNIIGEPSCVMFRKAAFEEVKGYDKSFDQAADLDLNLKLSQLSKVAFIKTPFLLRRIHENNLTKENFVAGKVSRDRIKIYEKYSKRCSFEKRQLSRFKVYLVASLFYDVIRASRSLNFSLAIFAFSNIFKYIEFTPSIHFSYFIEIISGKNKDAF